MAKKHGAGSSRTLREQAVQAGIGRWRAYRLLSGACAAGADEWEGLARAAGCWPLTEPGSHRSIDFRDSFTERATVQTGKGISLCLDQPLLVDRITVTVDVARAHREALLRIAAAGKPQGR